MHFSGWICLLWEFLCLVLIHYLNCLVTMQWASWYEYLFFFPFEKDALCMVSPIIKRKMSSPTKAKDHSPLYGAPVWIKMASILSYCTIVLTFAINYSCLYSAICRTASTCTDVKIIRLFQVFFFWVSYWSINCVLCKWIQGECLNKLFPKLI